MLVGSADLPCLRAWPAAASASPRSPRPHRSPASELVLVAVEQQIALDGLRARDGAAAGRTPRRARRRSRSRRASTGADRPPAGCRLDHRLRIDGDVRRLPRARDHALERRNRVDRDVVRRRARGLRRRFRRSERSVPPRPLRRRRRRASARASGTRARRTAAAAASYRALERACASRSQRDRKIFANRHQLLREPREIALLQQRFARTLLRQARRSGEDRFEIAELVHEVARRLLADALHAGHVVGACRRRARDSRSRASGRHRAARCRSPPTPTALRRSPVRRDPGSAARRPGGRVAESPCRPRRSRRSCPARRPAARACRSRRPLRSPAVRGSEYGTPRAAGRCAPSPVEVGLELLGQLLARRLVGRIPLVSKAEAGVVHPAEVLRAVLREQPLEEIDDPPRGRRVLATAVVSGREMSAKNAR